MLIGLKLDMGFSTNEDYGRLYGGRDVLSYLRELGVEAVETPVGPETDLDELREHVSRCIDGGMKVSLHPYSEATNFNPAFFSAEAENPCRELHEEFFALAEEAAQLQGRPTIVNIHAAAGTTAEPRSQLVDKSVAFFTWAGEWCRRRAPHVVVTVELQISPSRRESRVRIGDNYGELLAVAERSGVAVCWDFGHAWRNAHRYGGDLYPPAALVKRIGHVHCHDVGDDDHQPLIHGTVPWRDFLRLLADHGYDGRIILEVPPAHFLRAGGIETLTVSVAALRDFVAESAQKP
jgi:sugar phosphate isomerase/epimerase